MQEKGIFLLFARSRTDDFRHLISVTAARQDAPACAGLLVRRKRGTCSGNEGMGRMKRKMMMTMMKQNHVC